MKAVHEFDLFGIHEVIFIESTDLVDKRSPGKEEGASDPILAVVKKVKTVFSVKTGRVGVEGWDQPVSQRQVVKAG